MSESNLMRSIMLAVSNIGTRLFRFNVGLAWAGKPIKFSKPCTIFVTPSDVLLRNAYPMTMGVEGISDTIGWTPLIVTNEMVGKEILIFTAIEVKTPEGKTGKERLKKQENFIEQVNSQGGIGLFAHSPEEATQFIKKFKNELI